VTTGKTGLARAQGTRRVGGQVRGYPSDLTDARWQVIAAHLPAEVPGRRGRPRVWPLRRIVEAILYVDRTECPWRHIAVDTMGLLLAMVMTAAGRLCQVLNVGKLSGAGGGGKVAC